MVESPETEPKVEAVVWAMEHSIRQTHAKRERIQKDCFLSKAQGMIWGINVLTRTIAMVYNVRAADGLEAIFGLKSYGNGTILFLRQKFTYVPDPGRQCPWETWPGLAPREYVELYEVSRGQPCTKTVGQQK